MLSNQFKGLPGVENAGPALEGALQKNSGHAILWKTGETCLEEVKSMTAIVTDVHYRMSLALIRDLAQVGVKVVCCERENVPAPLGFASKYTAWSVTLPNQGYLEGLYDLCAQVAREEGENPALLPVGAATLALLSENRERFDSVCGLLIPTTEQLDTFNSKASVAALGEELGVPVPRQFAAAEGESLPDFFARVPLPCVVKPLCGEKFGLSAAQRYVIAQTPEAGRAAYEKFRSLTGEPPLVQEYLPGGALGCSVLAEEGTVRATLCHRRLREYPVSGGPSACCVRVDRPDLEDYAARLVAKVGFSGLAMFEFKEDSKGNPRLLEVNPRVWGTFPLTRISRSGIPLLWCVESWNTGNPGREVPLPQCPEPQSRKMNFFPSDLLSGLGYLKKGKSGKALGALADLLNPTVRDGLWEWGDPKPGLMYYRSLLGKEKP